MRAKTAGRAWRVQEIKCVGQPLFTTHALPLHALICIGLCLTVQRAAPINIIDSRHAWPHVRGTMVSMHLME